MDSPFVLWLCKVSLLCSGVTELTNHDMQIY